MNKLVTLLVASLAIVTSASAGTTAAATAPAKACDSCKTCSTCDSDNLGFGLGASYSTHYIFRGLELGEDWVRGNASFTAKLTDNTKLVLDASYGFLANDETIFNSAVGQSLSYERLELGAGVVTTVSGLDLGVGYRYYQHGGDLGKILNDTHEVGVTLGKKIGDLRLGLGAYYDITNEGWYFDARAAYEIKVCERMSLVPAVSVGYGVDYNWQFGTSTIDVGGATGFTAINLSLTAPIKVCKNVTVSPYIAVNLPVDALDGADEQVYGGVCVSIKF